MGRRVNKERCNICNAELQYESNRSTKMICPVCTMIAVINRI